MEMNNCNQFILCAWLEEGMLDIRKSYIDHVALLGSEANSILMDLQVTDCLLTDDIRANDKVL